MPLYLTQPQSFPSASSVNVIAPTADSVVPLRLQQHSATQSGNLLTIEKINGTVLSSLDSTGGLLTLGNGVDNVTAQLTLNATLSPAISFKRSSTLEWTLLDSFDVFGVVDGVHSRTQLALTPGAAGNATSRLLDSLQIQAGAGQTAGQLVFYASDGTTIQASLVGDAPDTLALRNGVNAQTARIYGTYTDASNYERLSIGYISGNGDYEIVGEKAGTGVVRDLLLKSLNHLYVDTGAGGTLFLRTAGVAKWVVDNSFYSGGNGHLVPVATNTYDIGVVSTQTVRNIFVGSSLVMKTKAGIPTDSDVVNPADGMFILDTTNHRFYVRDGGTWKFAALV